MKKKIITGMILLMANLLIAQTPATMNYQAVIRNSSGDLVNEQNVSIKISIMDALTEGNTLYSEFHSALTNAFGQVSLEIGSGSDPSVDFGLLNWGSGDKFLKVEVDVNGGVDYIYVGTSQLLSVPYALYADKALKAENLGSDGVYSPETDTLFVVKDHDGQVVFAVFPDGAQVVVNQTAKGKVGGFAVSGRSPSKAVDENILTVTPDSTRIYVNDTVNAKGKVGGFAVSGRSPSKGVSTDILYVTADSTRIFVNESSGVKGKVGGFAVSGRTPSKSSVNNFLDLTSDNYFIGHQAGANNTDGLFNIMFGYEAGITNTSGSYNTFLGYQSGYNNNASYNSFIGYLSGHLNSSGAYNTFIGYESGKNNIDGENNVFLGHQTGFTNSGGHENVFVGYRSGYSNVSGYDNIFIGNLAGENASANTHSTFIGNEAGRNMTGDDNICIGDRTGTNAYTANHESFGTVILGIDAGRNITGEYNTVLGYGAGSSWGGESTGNNNTFIGAGAGGGGYLTRLGSDNVCLGNNAGYGKVGDNKLYIANNSTTTLIYGNFASGSELVQVNGDFYATGDISSGGTTSKLSDFVFDADYKIETIEEHAEFMWKEKHLPAVKSAKQIEKEGKINMNERREQLLEELEKAHIYIEQLNTDVKSIKEENKELKQKVNEIINMLENK